MRYRFGFAFALIAVAGSLAACQSTVVPLRPLQTVEVDAEPETPATATAPATTTTTASTASATTATASATTEAAGAPPAATQAVAATAPTKRHKITRTIDPNQTERFVYDATYDHVWQRGMDLLTHIGFRIDRRDYRLGVLTTVPMIGPQFVELWRRDQTGPMQALESTVNNQRHTIRLTIAAVPGKPEYWQIAVQALVERQSNPTEVLGGPIFATNSGFGGNAITLRSDYTGNSTEGDYWTVIGRDPALEKKIVAAWLKKL